MKGKILFFCALAFVLSAGLASAEIIPISSCQVLDVEGAEYVLQNDIITSELWCFEVDTSNVILNLNGYKITGNGGRVGVHVDEEDSVQILNGTIEGLHIGIIIMRNSNTKVKGITIKDSTGDGISILRSTSNTIEDCVINNNNYTGVSLQGVNSSIFRNNEINNNLGEGILLRESEGNIFVGNTLENNQHTGISLSASQRNEISQNTMQYNNVFSYEGFGEIRLYNSHENLLTENKIKGGTHDGVLILNSNDNLIIKNQVEDNEDVGIYIDEANGNTIENNLIKNNRLYGVKLDEGRESFIFNNSFESNGKGLALKKDSESNIIEMNDFLYNGYYGIQIEESTLNILRFNTLRNNSVGLRIDEDTSGNSLHHNSFYDGYYNVRIGDNSVSYWNVDSGGNYWASPDGTGFSEECEDSDKNGICDEPYILDVYNIDYLPLKNSFESEPSLSLSILDGISKENGGSIRVENDGNENLENIILSYEGDFELEFSLNEFGLGIGESKTIDVNILDANKIFGINEVMINAQDSVTEVNDTERFSLKSTFCESGTRGGLLIKNIKIDNNGMGKDDEWRLFDTIKVEVEIENEGGEDIEDVIVELGLFNSNDNVVNDLEFENSGEEEVEIGDLDDGDEETMTFEFKVPHDFEDGNYKLAVKAYSDEAGEENVCIDVSSDLNKDFYEEIDVEREEDEGKFIYFENIELTQTHSECGREVSLTANIFNIGNEDQDRVKVRLVDRDSGIDQSMEITGLDKGDKEKVQFTFVAPNKGGDYELRISADYGYRRGSYQESSDKEEIIGFEVKACVIEPLPSTETGFVNEEEQTDRIIVLNKKEKESSKSFFEKVINKIVSWFK